MFFPEATSLKVLKAVQVIHDEELCIPILLGDENRINKLMLENSIELNGVKIINPKSDDSSTQVESFAKVIEI